MTSLPRLGVTLRADLRTAEDFERELFDVAAATPDGARLLIIVGRRRAQPFERSVHHLLRCGSIEFQGDGAEVAVWYRYLDAALRRDARGGEPVGYRTHTA